MYDDRHDVGALSEAKCCTHVPNTDTMPLHLPIGGRAERLVMSEIQESARMTAVRAACFRWFDQCHRTAVVRHLPIYARGNVVRDRDYVAPMLASEEWNARGIGTRGADAVRALEVPTVSNRARRGRAAGALVKFGSARFLAWYLPRFYARTLPMPTVALDASAAVAYAGLVDIDRVRYGVYAETPRYAVPTHEIDLQVTPSPTPRVKRFLGTDIALYGRLTPSEYAVGLRNYQPRSMVPEGVYLAALDDPMRYHPGAMALGRDTQTFLKERGETMPLVDTYDVYRHRWNSGPDRVAHRGTTRVRRPAPNRYQRGVKVVLDEYGRKVLAPSLDRVVIGTEGQWELETRMTRRYYCNCGPITTPSTLGAHVLSETGGYQPNDDKCRCVPRGWVGHRRVMFGESVRGKRATASLVKKARGRRAPNVAAGPWVVTSSNIARATRNMAEAVALIENAVRRLAEGETHVFSDGTRVVSHGAHLFDGTRLRMYPVRDWSRRYALQVSTAVAAGEVTTS